MQIQDAVKSGLTEMLIAAGGGVGGWGGGEGAGGVCSESEEAKCIELWQSR